MKKILQKSYECLTALVMLVMFAVSGNAAAGDIQYGMFDSHTPSNGTVTELPSLVTVVINNMYTDRYSSSLLVNEVSLLKNGVELKKVAIERPASYDNLLYIHVGEGITAAGEYSIVIPDHTYNYYLDYSWLNGMVYDLDNQEYTIKYTIEGAGNSEEGGEGEGEITGNNVTFDYSSYVGSSGTYYHQGDVLTAENPLVKLTFNEVGLDKYNNQYTYCCRNQSSGQAYLQIKDATVTISMPEFCTIKKIQFVSGTSLPDYDLSNLEAEGYADGVWTGSASSVTFNTKEIVYPVYDEDDNIIGSTTAVAGVRVSKIIVTYEGDLPEPAKPFSTSVTGYWADANVYFGTFYADNSYKIPEGYVAAVVPQVEENVVYLESLQDGVIPAGTAVLLYGAKNEALELQPADAEGEAYTGDNCLIGSASATTFDELPGYKYYILSTKGSFLGFLWDPTTNDEGATANCAANKAVLLVEADKVAGSNGLTIRFDDATAIKGISSEKAEGAIYNLQGQRVNGALATGVYVKNGKKFFVK